MWKKTGAICAHRWSGTCLFILAQYLCLLDSYRLARTPLVEMDGNQLVALVARLDGVGSSADGRILAYRRRPNASHKLSAERSLQPFQKSDLPGDDAYTIRAFSCDPKCFDAAYTCM